MKPVANHPPIEQWIDEIRLRNEQRLERAKRRMGERYVYHPANRVQRQPQKDGFLK